MTTCSDCGTQYTDDAPYCPNCGKPNPARQGTGTAAGGGPNDLPGGGANPVGTSGAGTGGGPAQGGGFSTPETPAGGGFGGGAPGGGYAGGQAGGYAGGPQGGGYGGAPGGGYGGAQSGGYGGGAQGGGYGGGQPAGGPPQNIPNYLVQAILVTLCCCLPVGIVSIVYATQVNTKRDSGDIAGALEASKNAKKWAVIGAVAGVIWLAIILAFNGLAFIAAMASGGHS